MKHEAQNNLLKDNVEEYPHDLYIWKNLLNKIVITHKENDL